MEEWIEVLGGFILVYSCAVNFVYLIFTVIAWRSITYSLHQNAYAGIEDSFASPLTPAVSILLPAFNEQSGIVESVYSLLGLRYPKFEIVVINDGSNDHTLARLKKEFNLVPVHKTLRGKVPTARVVQTYISRDHPELWVIDKENGGKADALNVGLSVANHPYFCAVDADAILEEDALLQVSKPIVDDPELVVATGGIIRIVNGCRVERGQVIDVRVPRSRLATLQVVEYFRAFLVGRIGWSRIGSLLIISGAFGLFRRDVVEEIGGYATTTVGEDMELVTRLHRYLRERGEKYRIEFVPNPVCWTEAPEDIRTLSYQRRRWQRGLAETLWRHRILIGNPRYGSLGLLATPYFLLFELMGPIIQLLGYMAIPIVVLLGTLSIDFLLAFLAVSLLLGVVLSVAALALDEFNFRRYLHRREIWRILRFALVENFGYRQLTDIWRLVALSDLARRQKAWGVMIRRGFEQ